MPGINTYASANQAGNAPGWIWDATKQGLVWGGGGAAPSSPKGGPLQGFAAWKHSLGGNLPATLPSTVAPTQQPQGGPPMATAPGTTQPNQDPFTSWMTQQGLFPYNMVSGGFNSSSGYNPGAFPNYSMDPYP